MSTRRRRMNWRPGWMVVLVCWGLWGNGGVAPSRAAKRRPAPAASKPSQQQVQAGRLVQQGVMALATRDFAAAYRALSAAYRLQPSADTLYQLGITALASGDSVAAQDLMRRYLAEAGPQDDAARRSEAQRIAERPREKSGEASVRGPAGAFVLVDERLVGRLPLPRPLLVAVGAHVLALELDGVITAGRVDILAGQDVEVGPTEDGKTLQGRRRPTIFVRSTPSLTPPLQAAIDTALAGAGLASFDAAAHGGDLPPPECAQDRPCLLRWAAAQGVQYALELDATAEPCALRVIIVDVAIGEEASRGAASCASPGSSERTLTELLPTTLREAMGRPQGTLRVTSQPPGAQVRIGERILGKTPLSRPSFAQPLELQLQLPGYLPESRQVVVAAQGTAEVQVTLKPQPATSPARSMVLARRRPTWRLAVGITALAIGAGLTGFGASALAIDGSCLSAPVAPILACERRYDTQAAGIGLVVPGALLVGTGITLLAIPGPLRPVEVATPTTGAAAGTAMELGSRRRF